MLFQRSTCTPQDSRKFAAFVETLHLRRPLVLRAGHYTILPSMIRGTPGEVLPWSTACPALSRLARRLTVYPAGLLVHVRRLPARNAFFSESIVDNRYCTCLASLLRCHLSSMYRLRFHTLHTAIRLRSF